MKTIMKKIMFNDKYGLIKAVLDKRKTQARMIVAPHAIWSCPTTNDEIKRANYR